jgi:hypothetical protein
LRNACVLTVSIGSGRELRARGSEHAASQVTAFGTLRLAFAPRLLWFLDALGSVAMP